MQTPHIHLSKIWTISVTAVIAVVLSLAQGQGLADELEARYFAELRKRGLYSLAESHASTKLGRTNLGLRQRADLVIELSQTLVERAGYLSEDQRLEFWNRAVSTIAEERNRHQGAITDTLLAAQAGIVLAQQGSWLADEYEIQPHDEQRMTQATKSLREAEARLAEVVSTLTTPARSGVSPKTGIREPAVDKSMVATAELLQWQHRSQFHLASVRMRLAGLMEPESKDRIAVVLDAEKLFRGMISTAEEPVRFRSKLGLAICSRLKGDDARWLEMVKSLEAVEPPADEPFYEEVIAEHARGLLEKHRATDAAELIGQTRSKRKRLTGELWLLRIRALASLRDIALAKKDEALATQLREQAELTLKRCDEQVGGYWSRRCREIWESVQTAEKYGPALDAAMQKARSDYLAGRIDESLTRYAGAAKMAMESGQADLAVELMQTRASILLTTNRLELAAEEFLRIARDHPTHEKAAQAHLNGAYAFGRLYEEKKTQSRREAFMAALNEHLKLFFNSPTVGDAYFYKAQVEEQRLQASVALPLYLQVPAEHSLAGEAHAGAARCFEAVLIRMRERGFQTADFEREAVETLTAFIDDDQKKAESPPNVHDSKNNESAAITKNKLARHEIELHLAAIVLMSEPPQFVRANRLLKSVTEGLADDAGQDGNEQPTQHDERAIRLKHRSTALRVIALAGSGQPDAAASVIESLAKPTPRELLAIAERMAPFVAASDPVRRVQYVELQTRITERLSRQRDELTPAEQTLLDRWQAQALQSHGELNKSRELYRKMSDAAPKDAARQREIALALEANDDRESQLLVRSCWRRVESSIKAGSAEWLQARLGVIQSSWKLGEEAEARKLLKLTKLLYPDLGGDEIKRRFEEVERTLATKP